MKLTPAQRRGLMYFSGRAYRVPWGNTVDALERLELIVPCKNGVSHPKGAYALTLAGLRTATDLALGRLEL